MAFVLPVLLRVAKNISKFPAHTVPILTSTVIECHRAGLFESAFTYASVLMRPEHRGNIDEKYKKKFESIIRKRPKKEPGKETEEPPNKTACPFCSNLIPESDLYCPQCKNNLPYCVATGYHIVATDLSTCSSCKFPGFRSQLLKLAQSENPCPMCSNQMDENAMVPVNPSQLNRGKDDPESQDPEMNGDDHMNGNESGIENGHPLSASSSGSSNNSRPNSYRRY